MPFDGTNVKESLTTKLLRDARALIADEKNWCAGTTKLTSPEGLIQFCATGAIMEASGLGSGLLHVDYCPAILMLSKHTKFFGIDPCHRTQVKMNSTPATRVVGHNNALGHEATLTMFDSAIRDSVANDMSYKDRTPG